MQAADDLGIVDITAERFSAGEIQGFLFFLLGCLLLCIILYCVGAIISSKNHATFHLSRRENSRKKMRKIDASELSSFKTHVVEKWWKKLLSWRRNGNHTRSARRVRNKLRRDSAREHWRSQGTTNQSWQEPSEKGRSESETVKL